MSISLFCVCGKRLWAKDNLAGRRVRCSGCGQVLTVPHESPSEGCDDRPKTDSDALLPTQTEQPRPRIASSGRNPSESTTVVGVRIPASLPKYKQALSGGRRRVQRWLIAAAILSAVGLVVWLVGGSGDDGHQGPPPPVRLEIDEIKVSEEVTYPAVRDNRGDRIVPPAPEGFQLSSSEGFVRFSSAALIRKPGAWKPIAGVLLIVSCKVAVDDPNPRLEEINLVRGNEKVASLDGLAQPDFTKATARDLSSQFAEARKKGSRPYVSLLFRIPIESVIYTEKLAIEVCWKDRSGKSFSNKVTLDDALRPAPVPKALGQIRVENDSDKKRAMWKAVVNNSSGKAVAEYLLKDHLALVRSLNKDDAKIPISEGNEYLRGKVVVLRGDRKGISERLLELMPAGDLATTPQEVGCILVFEEKEWDISNYYRSQSRQDDRSSAFSPGAVFQTTWITSMYNINTCKCEWRHVCSSGMPEEVRVGSISYATPAPEEGYRSFLARLVRKGR